MKKKIRFKGEKDTVLFSTGQKQDALTFLFRLQGDLKILFTITAGPAFETFMKTDERSCRLVFYIKKKIRFPFCFC